MSLRLEYDKKEFLGGDFAILHAETVLRSRRRCSVLELPTRWRSRRCNDARKAHLCEHALADACAIGDDLVGANCGCKEPTQPFG